jgi:hypothetical protein
MEIKSSDPEFDGSDFAEQCLAKVGCTVCGEEIDREKPHAIDDYCRKYYCENHLENFRQHIILCEKK